MIQPNTILTTLTNIFIIPDASFNFSKSQPSVRSHQLEFKPNRINDKIRAVAQELMEVRCFERLDRGVALNAVNGVGVEIFDRLTGLDHHSVLNDSRCMFLSHETLTCHSYIERHLHILGILTLIFDCPMSFDVGRIVGQ